MAMTNRYITLIILAIFIKVTVTAYHAPCKICHTRSRTYTGRNASLPGLAVDPRLIPLGSKVKINGKWYVADDKGPRGHHVDIRLSNSVSAHKKVKKFGRQYLTIQVKKK
ncbi:MAG: 3D domain-containing protein [Armatimonadota bacterium]